MADALLSLGRPQLAGVAAQITGELAVNAILHGRTPYRVAVSALPEGGARIEVSDTGGAMPRVKVAVGEDPLIYGRGLHIVEAFSDRWGVTSLPEGKTVWAEVGA